MITTLVVQRLHWVQNNMMCHDCEGLRVVRTVPHILCKVIFVHRAFKGRCVCALITLYRRLKSLWDVSHFGSSRVVSVSFPARPPSAPVVHWGRREGGGRTGGGAVYLLAPNPFALPRFRQLCTNAYLSTSSLTASLANI